MGLFSNLLHKQNVRVANLSELADALKEVNRKRVTKTSVQANNTPVHVYVAPFNGYVEELIIAAAAATASTNGNSVTVTVQNVTSSNAVLATFDTYANVTELTANAGVNVKFAPAISGGQALTSFKAGDVLSVNIQLNGSVSGWTSATLADVNVAFTPNDKHFAI